MVIEIALRKKELLIDILPSRTAGFQESLLGLPLSTTRLTLRSCLTNALVDVSRGV
jgi:hypothetical protein